MLTNRNLARAVLDHQPLNANDKERRPSRDRKKNKKVKIQSVPKAVRTRNRHLKVKMVVVTA